MLVHQSEFHLREADESLLWLCRRPHNCHNHATTVAVEQSKLSQLIDWQQMDFFGVNLASAQNSKHWLDFRDNILVTIGSPMPVFLTTREDEEISENKIL